MSSDLQVLISVGKMCRIRAHITYCAETISSLAQAQDSLKILKYCALHLKNAIDEYQVAAACVIICKPGGRR